MYYHLLILFISVQLIDAQDKEKDQANTIIWLILNGCGILLILLLLKTAIDLLKSRGSYGGDPLNTVRGIYGSGLTTYQRQAVLEMLFGDDNCIYNSKMVSFHVNVKPQ